MSLWYSVLQEHAIAGAAALLVLLFLAVLTYTGRKQYLSIYAKTSAGNKTKTTPTLLIRPFGYIVYTPLFQLPGHTYTEAEAEDDPHARSASVLATKRISFSSAPRGTLNAPRVTSLMRRSIACAVPSHETMHVCVSVAFVALASAAVLQGVIPYTTACLTASVSLVMSVARASHVANCIVPHAGSRNCGGFPSSYNVVLSEWRCISVLTNLPMATSAAAVTAAVVVTSAWACGAPHMRVHDGVLVCGTVFVYVYFASVPPFVREEFLDKLVTVWTSECVRAERSFAWSVVTAGLVDFAAAVSVLAATVALGNDIPSRPGSAVGIECVLWANTAISVGKSHGAGSGWDTSPMNMPIAVVFISLAVGVARDMSTLTSVLMCLHFLASVAGRRVFARTSHCPIASMDVYRPFAWILPSLLYSTSCEQDADSTRILVLFMLGFYHPWVGASLV